MKRSWCTPMLLLSILVLALAPRLALAELPPQVVLDMHMKKLAGHLTNKEYAEAAKIFPETDKLLTNKSLTIDHGYYYYRAETMYNTNQSAEAQKSLEKYLELTGTTGRYYEQSLDILNGFQAKLEQKKKFEQALLKKKEWAKQYIEDVNANKIRIEGISDEWVANDTKKVRKQITNVYKNSSGEVVGYQEHITVIDIKRNTYIADTRTDYIFDGAKQNIFKVNFYHTYQTDNRWSEVHLIGNVGNVTTTLTSSRKNVSGKIFTDLYEALFFNGSLTGKFRIQYYTDYNNHALEVTSTDSDPNKYEFDFSGKEGQALDRRRQEIHSKLLFFKF